MSVSSHDAVSTHPVAGCRGLEASLSPRPPEGAASGSRRPPTAMRCAHFVHCLGRYHGLLMVMSCVTFPCMTFDLRTLHHVKWHGRTQHGVSCLPRDLHNKMTWDNMSHVDTTQLMYTIPWKDMALLVTNSLGTTPGIRGSIRAHSYF